jgi:hypothetical protein
MLKLDRQEKNDQFFSNDTGLNGPVLQDRPNAPTNDSFEPLAAGAFTLNGKWLVLK